MIQERITPNYEVLPTFYHQLQTHPLYIDLTPSLESAYPPRETLKPPNLFPRNYRWHRECRRGLDLALKKLSEKDLAGKDHIESYLRDQYRRSLRPSTLANSLRGIETFMSFIQRRGKIYIEEIARQDIEGWIEHEQDRGMKASTVDMRLGTLKAFLRFLIEREVLSPELLSKRMTIKVPDALPRAMDPDDVRQLVTSLEGVRDRAMFVKYLEKAGLSHKRYTLHCLRHTCASELLNAGMRLECVQQLLGHSTIEMTRRYARLTDRTREEEYFRAMAIIERGEINGHYQLDCGLQTFFEKTQLLSSHDQELHVHS